MWNRWDNLTVVASTSTSFPSVFATWTHPLFCTGSSACLSLKLPDLTHLVEQIVFCLVSELHWLAVYLSKHRSWYAGIQPLGRVIKREAGQKGIKLRTGEQGDISDGSKQSHRLSSVPWSTFNNSKREEKSESKICVVTDNIQKHVTGLAEFSSDDTVERL